MPGVEQLTKIFVLLGDLLGSKDRVRFIDDQRRRVGVSDGPEDRRDGRITGRKRVMADPGDDVQHARFPAPFLGAGEDERGAHSNAGNACVAAIHNVLAVAA